MVSYEFGYPGSQPSNMVKYSQWMMARFRILVMGSGSFDFTPYRGTGNAWVTYFGGCCIYTTQTYPFIYATAATYGFPDPEGMFLHDTVDHPNNDPGHLYDQFDTYEQTGGIQGGYGSATAARNGVLALTGTATFTEETVNAYSSVAFTLSDRLLIGYQTAFDLVNIKVNAPASSTVFQC
jgi:hypothetical protein